MRASLLTLVAGAIAATLLGPAMADDDRPVMRNGRVVPAIQGIWRSRGYGYVVRMESRGPELFHVAGEFCYPDPRGERDPDGVFEYYRHIGSGAVAFSSEPGDDDVAAAGAVLDSLSHHGDWLHRRVQLELIEPASPQRAFGSIVGQANPSIFEEAGEGAQRLSI